MISTLNRPAWAPRGRAWAWGLSVLAHGAALAWLLHALPPRHVESDQPVREMRFVLVTPVPAPAPAPQPVRAAPEPVRPARAGRAAVAPRPSAPRAAPSDARPPPQPITMPADQPESAFTVAAPAATGRGTGSGTGGGFDMAAARSAARAATAGSGGPARGQPLRETRDEKLGRAIDGARNGDCQTQYAGMGLFAIIPLAKDTLTGSGCKWK